MKNDNLETIQGERFWRSGTILPGSRLDPYMANSPHCVKVVKLATDVLTR